jgi:hypothetical protein
MGRGMTAATAYNHDRTSNMPRVWEGQLVRSVGLRSTGRSFLDREPTNNVVTLEFTEVERMDF